MWIINMYVDKIYYGPFTAKESAEDYVKTYKLKDYLIKKLTQGIYGTLHDMLPFIYTTVNGQTYIDCMWTEDFGPWKAGSKYSEICVSAYSVTIENETIKYRYIPK